jgi:Demerecviridae HNH endonuclease
MIKPLPSRDVVRQLLDYDPATGVFTWRSNGRSAGYLGHRNRRIIGINHVQYFAHRLAWLYVHGEPVPDEIDHKDTDVQHNWISNLRDASHPDNCANQRKPKNNTSGIKGVGVRESGRFRVRIMRDWRSVNVGTFDTAEEAAAARREAAQRLHGSFRNDG